MLNSVLTAVVTTDATAVAQVAGPSIPYSALVIIVVFGGLIFFHELGHFLVAKAFKMGVKTFSIGFGPRLLGATFGKTEYRLSLLPLGGYVSLIGEQDPKDLPEGFTEKESFALRPAWQRFLVIIAGGVFNILLAFFIYFFLMLNTGVRPVFVYENFNQAPHALEVGDVITRVNGERILLMGDVARVLAKSNDAAGSTPSTPVVVDILRVSKSITVLVVPQIRVDEKTGVSKRILNVSLGSGEKAVPVGVVDALTLAYKNTLFATTYIGQSLYKLVTGGVSSKEIGGPILIAQEIKNAAHVGLERVALIAALLSVNLGLLNLLPIPVLDGGHALFLLVEMVTRRPVPEKVRVATMYAGLALLLGLMVFATYNDVIRTFFTGA